MQILLGLAFAPAELFRVKVRYAAFVLISSLNCDADAAVVVTSSAVINCAVVNADLWTDRLTWSNPGSNHRAGSKTLGVATGVSCPLPIFIMSTRRSRADFPLWGVIELCLLHRFCVQS